MGFNLDKGKLAKKGIDISRFTGLRVKKEHSCLLASIFSVTRRLWGQLEVKDLSRKKSEIVTAVNRTGATRLPQKACQSVSMVAY